MITEKLIIDAYVFLRRTNNSIPDEVLDFIKESSLSALRKQNELQAEESLEKPILRNKFKEETGIAPVFGNRIPYIDYINWLENKLLNLRANNK